MGNFSWKERVRYQVDNMFSRGPVTLILWLFAASLVVIAVSAGVISLVGIKSGDVDALSFGEAFWQSLMRTLDAGTMGGDTGWAFRGVMFIVTLAGVFVVSTLIGILSSGIEGKLDELRKGRSRIIESNHTVILGWNEQIFTIISELSRANQNLRSACIAVLADRDKVEMEAEVQGKAQVVGNTRVICRSGSPMEMEDISIASVNTARSIIVLSPDGSENPDSEVIKVILAITNHPNRRAEPYHIVAELRNPRNNEIAQVVGKNEVEWIRVGDLVARVIAQTCRQSGLSVVYTELLDFGGDEIYFYPLPAKLVGKSFGDALNQFQHNTVLGYRPAGGKPQLNPAMGTLLSAGDQLVMIAEDDDRIAPDGSAEVLANLLVNQPPITAAAESTLILGWNWKAPAIIRELDQYAAPGSKVHLAADIDDLDERVRVLRKVLKNQHLTIENLDTTDRHGLDALDMRGVEHVILLCYSDELDVQAADARTLMTLLHLRDMAEKNGYRYSVVSEMLDIRNRNLAEVTRADDFIVSDKLVSLMIAQVSENKHLNAVFEDIFDPEGSEIYLKPAGNYVRLGEPVNFYTVVESARQRGETALGYRAMGAGGAGVRYGVKVNPVKSEWITFNEGDKVVVLAEG